MKYYMLERGEEKVAPDDLVHAFVNPDTAEVTDDPEQAGKWAEMDKGQDEIRIVEFRITRLDRPVARRPKPALVWGKPRTMTKQAEE